MKRLCLLILAAAAACGSKAQTATDRNRAGTGSSTLQVVGDVTGDLTSAGPVTSLQVDLRDGVGAKVSGATVVIHNDQLGDVPLVEAQANSGRYVNSKSSFPPGDFILTVSRNTDGVSGVVVGSPGSHVVNAPTRNAVVPAAQPLQLSWTTPTQAKSVSIQTNDFKAQAPDTGTYTIPASGNPASNNQALDVARSNEVEIAGGLPGSRLRVTFTTTVDPYVVR
jgi:hypothetical protein